MLSSTKILTIESPFSIRPLTCTTSLFEHENKETSTNIKNTFLNPNSALFEEPENLLKQEVREPALYNAIITAIATGASRMSEISGKVGESTNICSAYVKNLISLGIIEKETPYGEKAVSYTHLDVYKRQVSKQVKGYQNPFTCFPLCGENRIVPCQSNNHSPNTFSL